MKGQVRSMIVLGLILLSMWQFSEAGYIHAKAWLAQRLIASAWDRSLAAGVAVKPWPWADTHPVARLEAPRYHVTLMVLAGASGRNLAFGPGHIEGTSLPGTAGNSVVSGHRDTHFAFLRDLHVGDSLLVHTPDGQVAHYRVSGSEVVRNKDVRVLLDAGDDRLTLVTSFPFDSPIPGGPLRYVVVASRVDDALVRM
jgi:sortase A